MQQQPDGPIQVEVREESPVSVGTSTARACEMTATRATPPNPLQQLLHVFNVELLGEGNAMAGANVLAAMCASITNVMPRGAGLMTAD